ncbi:MAG: 50S ribosomal protein L23 [Ruminococcaceae bacterium]|nr:50S ribosomal protein L23 [Oscillospiraceae bacterium]
MKEYDVIIRPHVTEKSTEQSATGKYTFIVAKTATKIDIKNAVEKLFNVKVLSVNTVRYDGKRKSRRQAGGEVIGYTPSYKKAIVQIDTDPKAASYQTKGGKVVKADKKYKNSIEEFGFIQ